MKPPACKVCNTAHWTYDGHSVSETEVPGYVSEMAKGALGPQAAGRYDTIQHMGRINVTVTEKSDETPVTKRNNVTRDETTTTTEPVAHVKNAVPKDGSAQPQTPTTGRPRKHKDAAARQRAYRERSK